MKALLTVGLVVMILWLAGPGLYDLSLDIQNQAMLKRYGWVSGLKREHGVIITVNPELDRGRFKYAFDAAEGMGLDPRAYLNKTVRQYIYPLDNSGIADLVTDFPHP